MLAACATLSLFYQNLKHELGKKYFHYEMSLILRINVTDTVSMPLNKSSELKKTLEGYSAIQLV